MSDDQVCIHDLVSDHARTQPEREALTFQGKSLTYGELNLKANQLAHRLIALGVTPDTAVGVFLERSPEFVVSILAVLKTGGYYVPLDPDYPDVRLRIMVETVEVPALVTSKSLAGRLSGVHAKVVYIDDVLDSPGIDPMIKVHPENLAYAMFTSGSTGIPKAVAVPHRGVIRLVQEPGYVHLDQSEVVLHASSTSFDAATFEIWGALTNGARLVIGPPGRASVSELADLLCDELVTTAFLTTGLFHVMVDECLSDLSGLRQLVAGGDVMSASRAHRVVNELPGLRLVNGYGPTEVTTFTTCHVVQADQRLDSPVVIGNPIRQTRVHILDSNLYPVPAGTPGFLYAGGDGLARGYLGDAALTAERFVPDPWQPGQRLYATGDLAQYRPDGTIEFLGRADQQVKKRGFRVELGEIEESLRSDPRVRDCAVIADGENADDKRLVAFVVLKASVPANLEEVKQRLGRRLPDHLLPDQWMIVDTLPLNTNGKLDRKALVATPGLSLQGGAAPQGELELAIAEIWCDIFQLEDIGRHNDFFELGGHSLLASRMVSRMRHTLGLDVPLTLVFDHPTIAQIAALIEADIGNSN